MSENSKKVQSLEHGKCLGTGKTTKSLEDGKCPREFVVFPVFRHFPFSKDFVVSSFSRHFPYSRYFVVFHISRHFPSSIQRIMPANFKTEDSRTGVNFSLRLFILLKSPIQPKRLQFVDETDVVAKAAR